MGLFAEWDFDGETLTARVDALGFYSLFYCEEPGAISVSSSPIQLIAEGRVTIEDGRTRIAAG